MRTPEARAWLRAPCKSMDSHRRAQAPSARELDSKAPERSVISPPTAPPMYSPLAAVQTLRESLLAAISSLQDREHFKSSSTGKCREPAMIGLTFAEGWISVLCRSA